MLFFDAAFAGCYLALMINGMAGGTQFMARIAGIVIASFVLTVLSACGRREVDSDHRALPSSATNTDNASPSPRSSAIESATLDNVVRSTAGTEADAVGQPSKQAMETTGGSSRSAMQGEGALVPSLISASGGHGVPSRSETLLTPLVAVGSNPALRLNARQTAEVVRLGQEFLAVTDKVPRVVSLPTEEPVPTDDVVASANAPAHSAWRSAQEESDARFRAMFGYSAFNAQQLMRAQQAYRDQLAARQ